MHWIARVLTNVNKEQDGKLLIPTLRNIAAKKLNLQIIEIEVDLVSIGLSLLIWIICWRGIEHLNLAISNSSSEIYRTFLPSAPY